MQDDAPDVRHVPIPAPARIFRRTRRAYAVGFKGTFDLVYTVPLGAVEFKDAAHNGHGRLVDSVVPRGRVVCETVRRWSCRHDFAFLCPPPLSPPRTFGD